MKAYVAVTGVLFGLLVLVHVWRAIDEHHIPTDPIYLSITILCLLFCFWAFSLLWRRPRP